MCTGIAIAMCNVPVALAEEFPHLVADREGMRELLCWANDRPALIPVQWDGQLQLLRWGSRDRRGRIPIGHAIPFDQVEAGALAWARPESAVVPATHAFDAGTWFLVEQGIWAAVLPDVPGGPVAYLLTRPSTVYYRNMTSQRPVMPVLVDQTI